MKNVDKITREIISKKDPFGYYIILASNNAETRSILEELKCKDLSIDEIGDILIIRCRSRRIAERLIRLLASKNLLVSQDS